MGDEGGWPEWSAEAQAGDEAVRHFMRVVFVMISDGLEGGEAVSEEHSTMDVSRDMEVNILELQ